MNMKKLLALLLAVVMVLCMAACSADEDDDKKSGAANKEGETIVGEWTGKMDFTEYLNTMMSDQMGVDVEADDLSLTITMDLKKNGEMSVEVDEDSAEEMISDLVDYVLDAMVEMLEDQGVSLEDTGYTKDQMREMLMDEMDMDATDLVGGFEGGYYVYEDGYIYASSDEDALNEDPEENAEEIYEVQLKGNTLKIKDIIDANGDSLDDMVPGVLPITLEK